MHEQISCCHLGGQVPRRIAAHEPASRIVDIFIQVLMHALPARVKRTPAVPVSTVPVSTVPGNAVPRIRAAASGTYAHEDRQSRLPAADGLDDCHDRQLPLGARPRSPRYAASEITLMNKISSTLENDAGWLAHSSKNRVVMAIRAPGAAADELAATGPAETTQISALRTVRCPAPRRTHPALRLVPQSSLVP